MRNQIEKLITFLGNKENIVAVNHCMTRLRIEVKNSEKVEKAHLEGLTLAKGVVLTDKNVQIVVGVKVKEVFKELENSLKTLESSSKDGNVKMEKKNNRSKLSVVSELFLPMISWILLTGFILAFQTLLKIFSIEIENIFKGYLEIIFENLIYYFPVGFSYSIVKRYKGSEIMGILLGLAICKLGYSENLLVTIVATLTLLKIKSILNKYLWDGIKIVTVPGISLILTSIIVKLVIGPLGSIFTQTLIMTLKIIFDLKIFPLIAMVFAGTYALSVKYGVQHILLFLDLQLILSGVGTYFWPIVAISNIAQGSASLGASIFLKDKKEGLFSSFLAYIGITEPAMYGINIKLKYPMKCAIIASAIGGLISGLARITSMGIGAGGLPALLIINSKNLEMYFYSVLTTLIIGSALTATVGVFKKIKEEKKISK